MRFHLLISSLCWLSAFVIYGETGRLGQLSIFWFLGQSNFLFLSLSHTHTLTHSLTLSLFSLYFIIIMEVPNLNSAGFFCFAYIVSLTGSHPPDTYDTHLCVCVCVSVLMCDSCQENMHSSYPVQTQFTHS